MDQYDFIFSLSDDDLFAPWMNPLYVLDAAMDKGHQMALFHSRSYKWNPDGGIELGIANFPEIELVCNRATLLHRVLTIVPCHVGLLYSTALLKRTVEKAKAFRGTLHLYVVPILFAAASNTLLFSDCAVPVPQRHQAGRCMGCFRRCDEGALGVPEKPEAAAFNRDVQHRGDELFYALL